MVIVSMELTGGGSTPIFSPISFALLFRCYSRYLVKKKLYLSNDFLYYLFHYLIFRSPFNAAQTMFCPRIDRSPSKGSSRKKKEERKENVLTHMEKEKEKLFSALYIAILCKKRKQTSCRRSPFLERMFPGRKRLVYTRVPRSSFSVRLKNHAIFLLPI